MASVVPVTVIEAGPCVVLQKKIWKMTVMKRSSSDLTSKKEHRANKPEIGHAKKAGTTPKRYIKEIRDVNLDEYEVGQEIKVDIFAEGEFVDVTGHLKGKGSKVRSNGMGKHGDRCPTVRNYHRGPGSMGADRS